MPTQTDIHAALTRLLFALDEFRKPHRYSLAQMDEQERLREKREAALDAAVEDIRKIVMEGL